MSEPGKITIDGMTVEPIRLKRVTGIKIDGYVADFFDQGDDVCVIESSLSSEIPAIWLGVEGCEMWLTRAHVAALLPHLQRFVERGDLGGEEQ